MAQRRRWQCPECGDGLLAPGRMRTDDTRRYCLSCSESTGRLVQRVCPALDRERADARTRAAERTQTKRAAERERWMVTLPDVTGTKHTFDARAEVRRALREMGEPTLAPELVIRRGKKSWHTGHAWPLTGRITITFGARGSYEAALETIYHEAAHLVAPSGEHHGPAFHRILGDALQGRWPFIVYGKGTGYAPDHRTIAQMKEHVREGGSL